MNTWGHLWFNLLMNSVLSFGCTLAIVYAVLAAVRVQPSACRLWLLLLPFAKLVIDLAAGVPQSAFLWAQLSGHTQHHGTFQAGLGVWYFGPRLVFMLGAFSGGLIYPQSFGGLLDGALAKRFGDLVPVSIAVFLLAIGLTRAGVRSVRAHAFMRRVQRGAQLVECRRAGFRSVRVLISDRYEGPPFANGIVRPRVVFSARIHAALDPAEREAALQHELAHVAHGDLALLAAVRVLAELFWFLPGLRGLCARVHQVLEERADERAVRSGVTPTTLASTLVRAGEILREPVPGAAMAGAYSALGKRVCLLLEGPTAQTRKAVVGRIAITVLVTLTVVQAIFAGNYHAPLVRFSTMP